METKSTLGAEISTLVDAVRDAYDDSDAEVDTGYVFLKDRCPTRLHRVLDDLPVLTLHVLDGVAAGPINLVGLAQRMGRPKGTVSKHVTRLADRGLVSRVAVPGNRKERTLALTEDGALIAQAHADLHRSLTTSRQAFLRRYTRAELEVLARVLRDVLTHARVTAADAGGE